MRRHLLAHAFHWRFGACRSVATSASVTPGGAVPSRAAEVERQRLWGPGIGAGLKEERRLARAIWGRMKAHGHVDIEARGPASVAGTLRALGWASKDGNSVVCFKASWVAGDDVRWLRFSAYIGERWNVFSKSLGRFESLTVAAKTDARQLALAVKAVSQRQRQDDGVGLCAGVATADTPLTDNAALGALGKSLATLPRMLGANRSARFVAVRDSKRKNLRVHVWIEDCKRADPVPLGHSSSTRASLNDR